jgi:hypothetical protein
MYAKYTIYLSNIVFQHLVALIDDLICKEVLKLQLLVVLVDYCIPPLQDVSTL